MKSVGPFAEVLLPLFSVPAVPLPPLLLSHTQAHIVLLNVVVGGSPIQAPPSAELCLDV